MKTKDKSNKTHSFSEQKSASELRELFTQLKAKYGFLRVRKMVCLAAHDILKRFEIKPQLQPLESAQTYRELFDSLKQKIPALNDAREMFYFLLIGQGIFENQQALQQAAA